MLLENSRKYLDVQPAAPLAGATQAKGKDYPNAQKQSSGRNFLPNTCFFCGSVYHWMKDCPHRVAQPAGSKGQSSSSGGKGQPVKPKPKSVPTPKGSNKGKGKGKGDSKKKPPSYSSGQGIRPSAKECNGEEDEEVPDDVHKWHDGLSKGSHAHPVSGLDKCIAGNIDVWFIFARRVAACSADVSCYECLCDICTCSL